MPSPGLIKLMEAYGVSLDDEFEQASEIGSAVSPRAGASALRESVARGFPPDELRRQAEALKKAKKQHKAAARAAGLASATDKMAGDDPYRTIKDFASAAGKKALSGVELMGRALDADAAWGRKKIAGTADPRGYEDYVRKEYPNVAKVADTVGAVVGAPGAAVGVGLGAIGDLASMASGESDKTLGDVWRTARDVMVKDSPRTGGSFILQAAPAPSNLLALGGGSMMKTAGAQAFRAARMAGLEATKAVQFAAAAKKIVEAHALTPKAAPLMRELAQTFKVGDRALDKAFGPGMEWLGRRTAAYGGVDVAKVPVVGPAAEKVLRKVGDVAGRGADKMKRGLGGVAPGLDFHARKGLELRLGQINKEALAGSEKYLGILARGLGGVGRYVKPERREWILKNVIDPAYKVVPVTPGSPPQQGTVRTWMDTATGRRARPPRNQSTPPNIVEVDIIPAPGSQYTPIHGLTDPHERSFAEAVVKQLDLQKQRLINEGVFEGHQGTENWLSDLYFPRIYKQTDPWNTPIKFSGGTGNVVKSRGALGGKALGSAFADEHADLFSSITRYQPQVEKTIAEKHFDKWVADQFADQAASAGPGMKQMTNSAGAGVFVPEQVVESLDRIRKNAAFQKYQKNVWEKATDLFKRNVLMGTPRYHLVNVMSDSMLMWMNGFHSPGAFVTAAGVWAKGKPGDVILRSPTGKAWTRGELQRELKNNGVGLGYGAFDIAPHAPGPADLESALRKGGGQIAPATRAAPMKALGRAAGHVGSLGLMAPGEKFAQAWERGSKTAMFVDRLLRGDSPSGAIARVFEALPDYTQQDKLLRTLRNFFPFATYQYKATKMVPRSIMRSPSTPANVWRYAEASGAKPEDVQDEAPYYLKERGRVVPLSGAQRSGVRRFVKGVGDLRMASLRALQKVFPSLDPGDPAQISEAFGMALQQREPTAEVMAPYIELLAHNNVQPMANMLHPILRAAVEELAGVDLQTKQRMGAPELTRPFAHGDPLAVYLEKRLQLPGGRLQAKRSNKQAAWAGRNVPQFLWSPLATWLLNELARAKGATGTPYGAFRPYTESSATRSPLQLLNLTVGAPIGLTTPMTGLQDEVQRAKRAEIENLPDILRDDVRAAAKKSARRQ